MIIFIHQTEHLIEV